MRLLKIALAQLRSNLHDKNKNLKRVFGTMEAAKDQGADFVLFPELFLTGFLLNEQVEELAESVEGELITKVKKYAKELQIGVILGFPERHHFKIYNSAVFINKKGEIVGTYRKIHLFDHENSYFTSGDSIPVFDTPQGKFGVMITYDMEFPEVARILALKGAEVVFVLCANMIPYEHHQHVYLRSRALENHIFIAAANKVGLEDDYVYFGESEVINPNGHCVFKSLNNEDLAIVDIDLSSSANSKEILNYLNNRKSDLYRREGL
ncbi:carbon-nitrogen hydrolase family protein [Priestia megaterium]|uniref:carbon-nitrogen hydrolase family protein n=1 Tax=Priestia megaterium TaxID=1404 RepID=UPI0039901BF6